ncbi:MAG: hypothetical protein JWO68_3496 [Actinomycetia bacterium]|nr:hypothetical protein [Actinomycetes bacterium]
MLTGTATVEDLVAGTVPTWDVAPVTLEGFEIVQAMFELRTAGREAVLPPALHPTNPPTLVVQLWRCTTSPWGPFELAQVRVQCRSGLRPRGFVTASVVDNEAAGAGLAAGWGFAPTLGEVRLRRFYDETTAEVDVHRRAVLRLAGAAPEPLGPHDVGWSSTLNLAHTPNGLRLVQLDLDVEPDRVERLRPTLTAFDAAAWGNELLDPWYPVSASIAVGRATLPPVRYCCRPDVLAFEGTETVAGA